MSERGLSKKASNYNIRDIRCLDVRESEISGVSRLYPAFALKNNDLYPWPESPHLRVCVRVITADLTQIQRNGEKDDGRVIKESFIVMVYRDRYFWRGFFYCDKWNTFCWRYVAVIICSEQIITTRIYHLIW